MQTSTPQLTIRAIVTGMIIGAVLSICNLYTGLKVGWLMGMSVPAALMAFGAWQIIRATAKTPSFSIMETNISQTGASAAASIGAAGLVAPIPALTILTGETFSWGVLVIWTFSVCLIGILVAVGLRRQMIIEDSLPFPSGMATGNTLKEMYAHGAEAMARMKMLLFAAIFAALVKVLEQFASLQKIFLPGTWKAKSGGAIEGSGISTYTTTNLGFAIEPTLMMYGVGALIGPRVGISIFIGTVTAWAVLAPMAFEAGWIAPGANDPNASWQVAGVQWLLWPGVALMISAALTSFAFSWKSMIASFRPAAPKQNDAPEDEAIMPRRWFLLALIVVTAISVTLQALFFDIKPWVAVAGVLFTFLLAIVATRVSGEANVTPVTAMGTVTQLAFALISPGKPAANLMAANVTGGAASQCADMMHDFKSGYLIGARPRPQVIAQVFGALAGALVGCAAYLILIKDPLNDLITEEWPAPAVVTWKAVAELFRDGLSALPQGALEGMMIGGVIGIAFAVMEKLLPLKARNWVPSPTAIGLAFVLPAFNCISLFLGAMASWGVGRYFKSWSARFIVIIASGLIAGESLTGVIIAIAKIFTGG